MLNIKINIMEFCKYYKREFISVNNPVFTDMGSFNHICTKDTFVDKSRNIIETRHCSFMNDFSKCEYFKNT